jgi:hypothetical protein
MIEFKGKSGYVYLTGIFKWARLDRPNQWGSWEICIYPNAESLETFHALKKLGLKNTLKKDDDGYHLYLRRPLSKKYQGKEVPFAPPDCLDKTGRPMSPNIGNGSSGIAKVEWYKYKPPKIGNREPEEKSAIAIRLESVKILDLVEFKDASELPKDEQVKFKELNEQPTAVW